MGEVYRARDTRLDRTVAVKILPSHLSENDLAKQRFDREARAISSLNHPNIFGVTFIRAHRERARYWRLFHHHAIPVSLLSVLAQDPR